MVQIFSKGRVSAEELSGQLGERFPAAVTQFAKANNMSTETLQANLKAGTVGLDMLSKFIESLGDEYVPLAKEIAKSNEEPFVLSIVPSLFTVSVSSTATGSLSLIPVTVYESSAVEVSCPSLTV